MNEHRPNQEQRILEVLQQANGGWVELPTILDLKIAQYSARIFGLRRKGYVIENDGNDKPRTRFRLVSEPVPVLADACQNGYHYRIIGRMPWGYSVGCKDRACECLCHGKKRQARRGLARIPTSPPAPAKEPTTDSLFPDAPERHLDLG